MVMKALLVLYVPLVASYHVTLPRHHHETAGRGRDLALRVARARAVQQQESEEPLSPSVASSNPAEQLERFFFDRAEVFVRSGAGGEGAIGWNGKRPAGGSGGDGGHVYVECTDDYNTLGHLGGRLGFSKSRLAFGRSLAPASKPSFGRSRESNRPLRDLVGKSQDK